MMANLYAAYIEKLWSVSSTSFSNRMGKQLMKQMGQGQIFLTQVGSAPAGKFPQ